MRKVLRRSTMSRAMNPTAQSGTGRSPRRCALAWSQAVVTVASIGLGHLAQAAGAGMPWEAPLTTFVNSLTGPVAKVAGVAAVAATGLGMAFSEGGSGMRKLVTVAFGLTIAFAATTFFLPLFGFAGGVAF